MNERPYQNCDSVIKSQCMKQSESTMAQMYNSREEIMNILVMFILKTVQCHYIFPKLNQNFAKESINSHL